MFTTVHTHTKQDGVLSSVIPFVEQNCLIFGRKKNSLKSDTRNIASWGNYARRQLRCVWLWDQQKDERHWNLEVACTKGRGSQEMETRVAERNYKDKRKRCSILSLSSEGQDLYLRKTL